MKTRIKVTVTAFVTSAEVDAEKSASVTAEVDNTGHAYNDWSEIVANLILQATEIGPDDFPFAGAKLMTPKAVEKYLAKETLA
jgi:hypothetical protein